jgi:HSP20 family protein
MAIESREGDTLVIRADLPGIDPESDVEIFIMHDVLHVRASHQAGPEPRDHPSDLRYGSFARDIGLPAGTREDQLRATYLGGVLEIRVPVGPDIQEIRRVPVQTGTMREHRSGGEAFSGSPPEAVLSSVMTTRVASVDAKATLRQAASSLRDSDVGTLVIMDGPEVVGIVSERDLVGALAANADPDYTSVGDVMSKNPRYATPGETVESAVSTMLAAGIRHLPVVDEGELVGIVSMRALVAKRKPARDSFL